jgi:hypothetical protein
MLVDENSFHLIELFIRREPAQTLSLKLFPCLSARTLKNELKSLM